MSHEIEPNGEAQGGPENDDTLPPAEEAPTTTNPLVGDDEIEDEDPATAAEVHG
jgi:hypothetical protein